MERILTFGEVAIVQKHSDPELYCRFHYQVLALLHVLVGHTTHGSTTTFERTTSSATPPMNASMMNTAAAFIAKS